MREDIRVALDGQPDEEFVASVPLRRLPVRLESDDRRVITRAFILSASRVGSLFGRLEGLSEQQVKFLLRGR